MHVSCRSLVLTASLMFVAGCHHGGSGSGNGDGGNGDLAPNPHGGVVSLAVSPPTTSLTVTDLTQLPTVALTATATYADNTTSVVSASWTLDRYDIAQVGASNGVVGAVGNAFGAAKVTATAEGVTGSAQVTVNLQLVTNSASATTAQQTAIDMASASDPLVGGLLYPYDKTVFPRALLAPELMWQGGADADLYRVHLTATSFDVTLYLTAANPSRFVPDQSLWNALGASAAPGDVKVELRRLDSVSGDAYVSASQTWTIANANLRGSIYYWAINQGQLITLDVSTGNRAVTFPNGDPNVLGTPVPVDSAGAPTPPWQSANDGTPGETHRCVACHAVSKDGSKLGAVFSTPQAGSSGPIGIVDLATQAVESVSDYQSIGIFNALSPDGSLTVANFNTKKMQLLDTATGRPIASALDALTNVCDPVFSPDGTQFSLATNCDPGFGYPIEYRTANLVTYAFDQASRTFSNPQMVITSAGIGDAIAFPSFSPDSKSIFFQRGSYSRAKYDSAPNVHTHGVDDLYLAPATANATAISLDAANGVGVLDANNLHLNYNPTVNPIAEGGYAWVVFTSPRNYGNRMVSTGGGNGPSPDPTYDNHKQLWVTAVNLATGTTDPSHPAFWMPGQDGTTPNMFGYWALSPCKATAPAGGGTSSCTAGYECCSGFCRAGGSTDGGTGEICVDTPSGCSQTGEKCTTASDCCTTGDACNGGICQGAGIQ